MDKFFGAERFEEGWHPAEDDLLYYVDGELPTAKRTEIRTHLEACWTCRARTGKIQGTISSFVDYLNDAFVPNVEPPPMGWRTFDAKMSRAITETVKRWSLSQWGELFTKSLMRRRLSIRWAATFLVTLCLVFTFVHFEKVSPVSASQLIQKATQAQEQRIHRVTHPIVYQKLRVQRGGPTPLDDNSITLEIWNDTTGNGFRQRVEDAQGKRLIHTRSQNEAVDSGARQDQHLRQTDVLRALPARSDLEEAPLVLQELNEILQSNRMNQRSPLSPIGYASWRESIRRQSEEVRETNLPGGEKALALITAASAPFSLNAIVKAELVIRTMDWHPVAQRFAVQGENGVRNYDLTETGFEVLASNALPHSIFEDRPVSAPVIATPPMLALPQAPPPATAELIAAEVEALFALHRVRACIGRPISVTRVASGRVEVKGLLDTEIRKVELLSELKGIPWLSIKIQTIEETRFESPSEPETSYDNDQDVRTLPPEHGGTRAKSEKLVIQDLLEEYFSAGQEETPATSISQKIASLSHNAVSFSEAALEEAWALRRLAELTSSLNSEELRTSSQRLLELMVRDHLSTLRTEINSARTLVRPVLSALLTQKSGSSARNQEAAPGPPNPENAGWALASLHLFSAIDQSVRLTLSLFADTGLPVESREDTMRELLGAFDNLEGEFQNLEFQVAQAFSERLELLTSEGRLE